MVKLRELMLGFDQVTWAVTMLRNSNAKCHRVLVRVREPSPAGVEKDLFRKRDWRPAQLQGGRSAEANKERLIARQGGQGAKPAVRCVVVGEQSLALDMVTSCERQGAEHRSQAEVIGLCIEPEKSRISMRAARSEVTSTQQGVQTGHATCWDSRTRTMSIRFRG